MNKNNVIIIIMIALLIAGLFTMILVGSDRYLKSQREKASNLGCKYNYDDFCYKEDSTGDLVRYEMKYLEGKFRLVRG